MDDEEIRILVDLKRHAMRRLREEDEVKGPPNPNTVIMRRVEDPGTGLREKSAHFIERNCKIIERCWWLWWIALLDLVWPVVMVEWALYWKMSVLGMKGDFFGFDKAPFTLSLALFMYFLQFTMALSLIIRLYWREQFQPWSMHECLRGYIILSSILLLCIMFNAISVLLMTQDEMLPRNEEELLYQFLGTFTLIVLRLKVIKFIDDCFIYMDAHRNGFHKYCKYDPENYFYADEFTYPGGFEGRI